MDNLDNKQKIIMIVNGQPIEMCLKTLKVSNKRSQKLITSLKRKSMEQAHTMRLFWGDVIMLNIITNQLLQKVDSKSLSRILKPVESLQADLDEYRENRKDVAKKLKDVLIVAHNDTLPLDYSHELEKYYKSKFKSEAEEDEFDSIIGAAVEGMKALDAKNALKESEDINEEVITIFEDEDEDEYDNNEFSDIDTKKTADSTDAKENISKNTSHKTTTNQVFSYAGQKIYREDENEETVDFSSLFSSKPSSIIKTVEESTTNNQNKKQTKKQKATTPIPKTENVIPKHDTPKKENTAKNTVETTPEKVPDEQIDISNLFQSKKDTSHQEDKSIIQQTKPEHQPKPNAQEELQKTEEAFASYGSIDLNSLFG